MGIDAASHRGSLAGSGPTIAISAAGVDIPVPSSNDSLFARLYESGAVISEVPIGQHPNRRRFLVRNRVIAALTPVTVVVEAALRSGALSTARSSPVVVQRLSPVQKMSSRSRWGRGNASVATPARSVLCPLIFRSNRSSIRAPTDRQVRSRSRAAVESPSMRQRPRCTCSNARGWSDRRLGGGAASIVRHRQVCV